MPMIRAAIPLALLAGLAAAGLARPVAAQSRRPGKVLEPQGEPP